MVGTHESYSSSVLGMIGLGTGICSSITQKGTGPKGFASGCRRGRASARALLLGGGWQPRTLISSSLLGGEGW